MTVKQGIKMAFFSFIYKYGIWISIPTFIIAVILLIMCITDVFRTGRQARLLTVPLVDRQQIEFKEPGRVVLNMEGPMLSRRFAKLTYELTGPDGVAVKSRPVLFRSRTTGLTKVRMELRIYEITHSGPHVFKILGLGDEKSNDTKHAMVFMRPHLKYIVLYIMGIVLTGVITIGSIVLFFMRLVDVSSS